jgi:lysine 6-dehydrogenase
MLAACMAEKLDLPGPDVVLLLAEAEGWDENDQPVRHTIRIIDHHDSTHDISAMMRMTGYPAAIIARMLAAGTIKETGAHCQELVVPGQVMLDELKKRGVQIAQTCTRPGEPA